MKNNRLKLAALGAIFLIAGYFVFPAKSFATEFCGNGIVEAREECDKGPDNSDLAVDGCRTNCVWHFCGDGVKDSNEQCDQGLNCGSSQTCNNDRIPNFCRSNCRLSYCGDGVLDNGEECDDANANAFDGCNQCKKCYPVKDNLTLSNDMGTNVRLCAGTYDVKDSGSEGVVIISGDGMNVDCAGMALMSSQTGPRVSPTNESLSGRRAAQVRNAQSSSQKNRAEAAANRKQLRDLKLGLLNKRTKNATNEDSQTDASEEPASEVNTHPGPTTTIRYGTGIVVKGENVVLHNCEVSNFSTGIKLKSSGAILFNNRACNNSTDIDNGQTDNNYGVKNSCATQKNWQENNASGCTSRCDN